jgi:hypothetical protein
MIEQELCQWKTPVLPLSHSVEYWRLPSDTGCVHRGVCVYIGATIDQKLGGRGASIFRGHVQERRSLEQESASGSAAAVECGKALLNQTRICIQQFSQPIGTILNGVQHAR